eukprot:TRINITY_DN1730_c0_g1_i5.p1 TRINITY_DN1730_c0_g1~~TRINITY_DN1730_c0_g1_i5.p1  ORF type:complete len:465 (-),score=96.23 TRINITY_DN1730_c0_g1_i5:28-1422(-)
MGEYSLHRTQAILFFSVFFLVFDCISCLILIARRSRRVFDIMGWPLLLVSYLGAMMEAFLGILVALTYGESTNNQCKAQSIMTASIIPLMAVPILLTASRLLFYVRLEQKKGILAQSSFSDPLLQRQQRLREILGRPTTYILVLTFSLVPLAAVSIVQELDIGTWVDVSVSDGRELRICANINFRSLTLIYALVAATWVAWLSVQLKRAKENFGIKSMYMRQVYTALIFISIWALMAFARLMESTFAGLIAANSWPFFSLYLPMYEEFVSWNPLEAEVTNHFSPLRTSVSPRHKAKRALKARSTSASSSSSDLSLFTVLADPRQREEFTAFLNAEFSGENILFLQVSPDFLTPDCSKTTSSQQQSIETYREAPSVKSAVAIVEMYIAENAPLQVNVSDAVRKRLVEFAKSSGKESGVVLVRPPGTDVEMAALTEQSGADLFAEAEAEISRLLEFDSLRRYLYQH